MFSMKKIFSNKLTAVALSAMGLLASVAIFFSLEKDPEFENLEISAEVVNLNIADLNDLRKLIINLDPEKKIKVKYSAMLMPDIYTMQGENVMPLPLFADEKLDAYTNIGRRKIDKDDPVVFSGIFESKNEDKFVLIVIQNMTSFQNFLIKCDMLLGAKLLAPKSKIWKIFPRQTPASYWFKVELNPENKVNGYRLIPKKEEGEFMLNLEESIPQGKKTNYPYL